MERRKASDYHPEVLKLFDGYVHGRIGRREFLDGAGKFAVGGFTAAAMLESLRPELCLGAADQEGRQPDQDRVRQLPVAAGLRHHEGLFRQARECHGKLPGVVVIHENRGLNPYIEDVARRLAVDGFLAFAPDALTPLGGYPNDEEKAAQLLRPARCREAHRGPAGGWDLFEDTSGLHGQDRRRGLLLRRNHCQHVCGAHARPRGGSAFLWWPTQRRGRGQDQGAASPQLRRQRRAHQRGLARL